MTTDRFTSNVRLIGVKPKDVYAPYDRKKSRLAAKEQLEAEYAELRTRTPGNRG